MYIIIRAIGLALNCCSKSRRRAPEEVWLTSKPEMEISQLAMQIRNMFQRQTVFSILPRSMESHTMLSDLADTKNNNYGHLKWKWMILRHLFLLSDIIACDST